MSKFYTNSSKSYPKRLPWRIRLSDGSTRTDPSTFTAEEIADAGFIEVESPPEVLDGKILAWSGTNWQIIDAPPNSNIDPGI